MAVTMRTSALTRRRFLAAGLSSTALAAVPAERLRRQEHSHLGGAVMPRLPRVHADARDPGRSRADLPQGRLRAATRYLPVGHALLSHGLRRGRRCRGDPGAGEDVLA